MRVKSFAAARLGIALVLASAGLLAAGNPARADSRAERPLQLQIDLYGLSVGYHFSDFVYVGATRQFGTTGNRFYGPMGMMGGSGNMGGHHGYGDENDSLYGQDGVTDDDLRFGDRTSIEIRFTPEPFGLYLAVGVLILAPDKEDVVWDSRSRTVGGGTYQTGLGAEVEGKSSTVPAAGAGINHVFPGGLSLGAGFLVGVQETEEPDVTVTATNSNVSAADLALFRKRIRRDFTTIPYMLHIAVGYNF